MILLSFRTFRKHSLKYWSINFVEIALIGPILLSLNIFLFIFMLDFFIAFFKIILTIWKPLCTLISGCLVCCFSNCSTFPNPEKSRSSSDESAFSEYDNLWMIPSCSFWFISRLDLFSYFLFLLGASSLIYYCYYAFRYFFSYIFLKTFTSTFTVVLEHI